MGRASPGHERDVEEELGLIAFRRGQIARILRLVEPDAWHRQAVHRENGLVTVRGLVLHPINHQSHHLTFVQAKGESMGLAADCLPNP